MDNITQRKRTPNLYQSRSFNDLSTSHIFDSTMTSLPSTSLDGNRPCCEVLQEQINQLTSELRSANNEIDLLNEENINLKNELTKCQKSINLYKKLDFIENSPKSSNRKNRRNKIYDSNRQGARSQFTTPEKCNQQDIEVVTHIQLVNSEETAQKDGSSPINDNKCSIMKNSLEKSEITYNGKPNSKNLIPELDTALNEIKLTTQKNKNSTPKNKKTTRPSAHDDTKRRQLCVLSNSTQRGILQAIEENFSNDFKYCSYLMPDSKIIHLLTNIKTKLRDFSVNDYCIILLGDSDIKTNSNFINLVKVINESLRQITHTNIIICTPTYVRGSPIYNYKVEIFNNLIYMDLEYHKYAYFFDSNNDLEFKFDLFSNRSGKLNKAGLNFIFKNIMDRIKIDFSLFPYVKINENEQNSQFFLL